MNQEKLDWPGKMLYGAVAMLAMSIVLIFGATLWVMFIRWVQEGC